MSRHETRDRPGGRLDPLIREDQHARRRSHAGCRLPSCLATRYGQAREAFLPPEPKRSRSIRQRERKQYGMGLEGVDEMVRDGEMELAYTLLPLVRAQANFSIFASAKR